MKCLGRIEPNIILAVNVEYPSRGLSCGHRFTIQAPSMMIVSPLW